MFNDRFLLTKAVIEGDKTQSRSIIYPQPKYSPFGGMVWKGYMSGFLYGDYAVRSDIERAYRSFAKSLKYKKFVYKPEEILAVAQPYSHLYAEKIKDWAKHNYHHLREDAAEHFLEEVAHSYGWSNKCYVKAKLMKHHIIINDLKVKQLQDISDKDILKEGIKQFGEKFGFYDNKRNCNQLFDTARLAYEALADLFFGKDTWENNPYVIVYDFEIKK
jgi:hypothetical protein